MSQNGEGDGIPLQYSCLENPTDGKAWWATVHGVTKSRTRLSDVTFTFHSHALEKEMATHSSVLAWRIPGTGEPGRLPSMGWHRVRHDWSNLAAAAAEIRNKWKLGISERTNPDKGVGQTGKQELVKCLPLALYVTDFLEVQLTALPSHTLISGVRVVP